MKISVLGNEGSWYLSELQQAARRRGHSCDQVNFRNLTAIVESAHTGVSSGGQPLHDADAVVVRTMPPGSLEQVVFRMDVLHRLEAQGVAVLNSPRAVECAVDKFLATSRLAHAGLPTPATIACESSDDAMAAFERLGGDVVVKPVFGSEGRGIFRVSDPDLAHRAFRTLERTQSLLYLQRFIDHPGFDLRILVLNGQALGAIRRRHPTDFRTNVARQAIAEPYSASLEEESWALRAAEAVGACFAGVDLLYDSSGQCYVIEVNAVPGWRAFQRATQIDVAQQVIQYLENRRNAPSA